MKAVEVHHDNLYVYGYQFFYQDNKVTDLHRCNQAHDQVIKERFELEPNEYIVGIGGRFGDWCDNLWLMTSHSRFKKFGGQGGQHMECRTEGA